MNTYQKLRSKGLPALYCYLVATFPNENEYNTLISRGLVVAEQDNGLTIQQYPTVKYRRLPFGSDAIASFMRRRMHR